MTPRAPAFPVLRLKSTDQLWSEIRLSAPAAKFRLNDFKFYFLATDITMVDVSAGSQYVAAAGHRLFPQLPAALAKFVPLHWRFRPQMFFC